MERDARRRAAASPPILCLDLQRFAAGDPENPLRTDGLKRRGASASKTRGSTVTTLPRPGARKGSAAKTAHAGAATRAPNQAPTRRVPPPVDSEVESRTVKYVVQAGDTLHKLAKQFDTTPKQLAVLNDLHKPTILFPGDVLLVPDHKG